MVDRFPATSHWPEATTPILCSVHHLRLDDGLKINWRPLRFARREFRNSLYSTLDVHSV